MCSAQTDQFLENIPQEYLESDLVKELISQKEELEKIFIRYVAKFEELRELIGNYQLQQVRVRKTMRLVQSGKKEKTTLSINR